MLFDMVKDGLHFNIFPFIITLNEYFLLYMDLNRMRNLHVHKSFLKMAYMDHGTRGHGTCIYIQYTWALHSLLGHLIKANWLDIYTVFTIMYTVVDARAYMYTVNTLHIQDMIFIVFLYAVQ